MRGIGSKCETPEIYEHEHGVQFNLAHAVPSAVSVEKPHIWFGLSAFQNELDKLAAGTALAQ
jgi:hypothetical protein